MRSYLRQRYFSLTMLVALFACATGQASAWQDRPLTEILELISESYQVIFTYDDNTVANVSVDYELDTQAELETVVNRVLAETGLKYRYIGERYYIIYRDTKLGQQKAKKISRQMRKIQRIQSSRDVILERRTRSFDPSEVTRSAQQFTPAKPMIKPISGTVTDSDGVPLVGVTVLVQDGLVGTATDIHGRYDLEVPDDAEVIVFSYTGYRTREISIGDQAVIDVVLEADVAVLDEVVVIGFGEKNKRDLTGSISSIDAKTIGKTIMLSPQFALQGNTAGVRVVNTNGDPNAEPQIQVRGVGTWNGRAQPLYVIDGQIINEVQDFGNQDVIAGAGRQTRLNLWNLINPQDIESISVLKDASAAAIYGARAANGVVLITTKRGKEGRPVVEFGSSIGWSKVPNEDRLLNTQQWVMLNREAHENSLDPNMGLDILYGRDILPADESPEAIQAAEYEKLTTRTPQMDPQSPYYINENSAPTYDHQDYLFRSGHDANYSVKVSGANDAMNYYVSLGYRDYEHPHVGNDIERYTGAVNLNTDISRWLKNRSQLQVCLIAKSRR